MYELEQVIGQVLFFTLVVTIMLGGMSMIVGGSALTKKLYSKMYKNLLATPARRILRYVQKQLGVTICFLLRKSWHTILWTCKSIWVWLTT